MPKKNIIIPDRIFHKLWDASASAPSFDDYYSNINDLSSNNHIDLNRYSLDINASYDLLKSIYDAHNISIKQIIEKYNFTKASFAHRFCIPIRTIENWCAVVNKCPSYTKLLILRDLNYPILPQGIYIESFVPNKKGSVQERISTSKTIVDTNPKDDTSNFSSQSIESFSLRSWEQTHISDDNSDLLSKTDYLSEILRRRSRIED